MTNDLSTDDWVRAPAAGGPSPRWIWLLLGLHALVFWVLFGTDPLGASWRECDTQAVARNLVGSGFDIMRPQVDWRGATDGAVESECPLYAASIAAVLHLRPEAEWPGRLLSLVSTSLLGWAAFQLFMRRTGVGPALVGTLTLLLSAQMVFTGTRVMPDAMSAAFAMVGLVVFLRFLATGSSAVLAAAVLLTLIGSLTKPTSAQVVLVQAAWTLLLAPKRLREVRTWVGWAVVVIAVAAWTLHARGIGLATGLSFGVTFGDTKMPGFSHLVRPGVYRSLLSATLSHGAGWIGLVAAAFVILRRRFDRADMAFSCVVGLALLTSLRYSHAAGMGPQYHIWSAIAGAWFVARAVAAGRGALAAAGFVMAALAVGAWEVRAERVVRDGYSSSLHLITAAHVRARTGEMDLIVVRGPKPAFDEFWRRRNNYEEPVLLYQSRRKGWVLPFDGVNEEALARCRAEGAKWFVDPYQDTQPVAVAQWLAQLGPLELLPTGASIHRLR